MAEPTTFAEAVREFETLMKGDITRAESMVTAAQKVRAISVTPADFALADMYEEQGKRYLEGYARLDAILKDYGDES